MNGSRKGIMLLTVAGFICLWMLSSCVHYVPREEQSSETNGAEAPVTDEYTAAEEEAFPNLPSADATKRY